MFICEPHHDMWNRDTGCPYCRERTLQAKYDALREVQQLASEILENVPLPAYYREALTKAALLQEQSDE